MPIAVALLLLAAGSDSDAALLDRAKFPPDEPIVYLTLSTVPAVDRERLEAVTRFVVPSLSAKSYLAEQLPERVTGTNLLRLNMRGLGWKPEHYRDVLVKHYVPLYRPDLIGHKVAPLVVRADWFCANMLDPVQTPGAKDLLLYGKPMTTADEWLKFWGIQNDAEYVFGLIETQSGVANQRTRLIENRPGAKRNVAWLTRDSEVIAGKTDPLENLPNKAAFDAQELIAQNVKWFNGKSGALQDYFLANGKGESQNVAPARIVIDHSGIRGAEIRTGISCIACHTTGILSPTTNVAGEIQDGFRTYIEAGARVSFLNKEQQIATDRYHTSDVAKEVKAGQEAYSAGIELCNGLTAAANTAAFVETVKAYDAPVNLAQAAREVYATEEDLKLALGNYSRTGLLSGRLSLLAQNKEISREQWAANYHLATKVMALWHSAH